jgi:hypothetical protein
VRKQADSAAGSSHPAYSKSSRQIGPLSRTSVLCGAKSSGLRRHRWAACSPRAVPRSIRIPWRLAGAQPSAASSEHHAAAHERRGVSEKRQPVGRCRDIWILGAAPHCDWGGRSGRRDTGGCPASARGMQPRHVGQFIVEAVLVAGGLVRLRPQVTVKGATCASVFAMRPFDAKRFAARLRGVVCSGEIDRRRARAIQPGRPSAARLRVSV